MVDPISALLDAPRARDAFLLRATMAPPWSLRIQDEAALTVVAMTRGTSVMGARRRGLRRSDR